MSPHGRLRIADSFYAALTMPSRPRADRPSVKRIKGDAGPITGFYTASKAWHAAREEQIEAAISQVKETVDAELDTPWWERQGGKL